MKLIKKLKTIGLGIVLASLTLVSCEKAGSTPPPPAQPTNYFTTLGSTYELASGCITSDSGDSFIALYSSSITLNADLEGLSGVGDGLGFSVYGSNPIGTYTYDSTIADPALPGEYDDAEYMINADVSIPNANGTTITGGTITIANGNTSGTYIIDINANNFVLHYEGVLDTANLH